jgi:hypothetical protein
MAMNDNTMVITNRPATEADVQAFHNEERATLAEAPRFQGGGQHDTQDRGVGSGIGVAQRGAHDPEYTTPPPPEVPNFVQDNVPRASQQDFQQMYGQSENEKGQWRKTATEAMAELEKMKLELGAMRAAVTPNAATGYPQPQTYGAPQPAQAQQAPQLPETFFPEKEPGDFMEAKDVDALVRNVLAPAVLQLNQQQLQLQQQSVAAQKAAAGITPIVEAKLNAECPWLQAVPEGPTRIQAMQGVLQQLKAAQPQQPQQPQQTRVAPEAAAARRVTYVESQQAAKSSESEVPLQQRIAQEMAGAKTAAQKKAILMKYGMQQANDWGPDVWGPAR